MEIKLYEITAEDGVLMTVVTAFIGSRLPEWMKSSVNQFELIVIFFTIFAYTIMISRFRYNCHHKKWFEYNLVDIVCISMMIYAYCYFNWFATNYLNYSDKVIFLVIAVIWLVFSIGIPLINFLIDKKEKLVPNQEQSVNN